MDKRIGAQLFTLRDFCKTAEDFDVTLKRVKDIGYKTLQLSAIGPIPPEEIKEIADKHGLDIILTHRPFTEFTDNIDALIKYHKTIGADIAGLGMMPIEYSKSKEGVMEFIKITGDAAKELSKNDMVLSYHNHAFEFAKIDGKYIFDILLENTPEDSYKFLLDVFWIAYGGVNPKDWIMHCKDRIASMHFKDFKVATGENKILMAEVMEGNLNWDEIIEASEKAGAPYAFVEQDICNGIDPFICMETSYKNLTKKGFI